MNKGIEWALDKAREELKQTGRGFRRQDLRETWTLPDSVRVESYERSCHELRAIIKDLEKASRVVLIDLQELPK